MLSDEVKDGLNVVIGGRARLDQSPNARQNPLNKNYDPSAVSGSMPEPVKGPADEIVKEKAAQVDQIAAINTLEPIPSPMFVPKAGGRGRLVTRLDITFNSSGKIVDYQWQEIEVSDKFEDDTRMDQIARGYDTEILSKELNAAVGRNYAGSQACYKCHPAFEAVWAKTGHFKAYDTIVSDNKLEDRTCTRCHAAGYAEEPRLLTYDLIPENLKYIGCEGCHVNGQRHIQLQDNLAKMTPEQRANATTTDPIKNPIEPSACALCHTGKYGVGWDGIKGIQDAKAICMAIPNPWVVPQPDEATPTPGGQ
jgi:hypothetical protein